MDKIRSYKRQLQRVYKAMTEDAMRNLVKAQIIACQAIERSDKKKQTATPKQKAGRIKPHLIVTQHAITRFQERVAPLGKEEIRKLLTTDSLLEAYRANTHGKYPLQGHKNIIVVIEKYKVVTVYDKTKKRVSDGSSPTTT
ncbi:MAG TPA: DUF4258 domain-containing protein [Flavisolibacter sp.]|nr:DUF4258 domain-containing protein [Flavisolibacter sp.]